MIDSGSQIINSAIGGSIMAIATSLHLYLQGKITGMSGALYRCISFTEFYYNFSFILGMLFTSSFLKCFYDPSIQYQNSNTFLEIPEKYVYDLSLPGFILAGFLVGFGAKMANGCTSGHGLCGVPRLSKRSFTAVALFLIFGGAMATIRYYHPFLLPVNKQAYSVLDLKIIYYITLITTCCAYVFNLLKIFNSGIQNQFRDNLISFAIGALFAYGLIESGMLKRHIVVDFLTIAIVWDIKLGIVLAAAIGINFLTFNYILNKISKPLFQIGYELPMNTKVDNKLCLGAAIFGLGWGLAGICPGPAILTCYLYCPQILAFFCSLLAGLYIENYLDSKIANLINSSPPVINAEFAHLDEEKFF